MSKYKLDNFGEANTSVHQSNTNSCTNHHRRQENSSANKKQASPPNDVQCNTIKSNTIVDKKLQKSNIYHTNTTVDASHIEIKSNIENIPNKSEQTYSACTVLHNPADDTLTVENNCDNNNTFRRNIDTINNITSYRPQHSISYKPKSTSIDYSSNDLSICSKQTEFIVETSICKYKLRFDTDHHLSSSANIKQSNHEEWFIQTPLIDLNASIDLDPALIRQSLDYFILSGRRLSQMTKVYNDSEALTHLLEEKERDLELAARIGQTLLDENKAQNERIEDLEYELLTAKEKIIQLSHDVSTKAHLLELCLKNEECEDIDDDVEETSLQDCSILSLNNAAQLVIELEKRVGSLEDENYKLKNEKIDRSKEIENEEKKELELIAECGRNLKQTHQKFLQLQDDFQKKVEENQQLCKDLTFFKNKSKTYENQLRKLISENEELEHALSLSNECQSELSLELIGIKEQHNKLLAAFHEKQLECRELIEKSAMNDPYFSYVESLAYELEQPHEGEETMINYDCDAFKLSTNLGQFGIHDSGFAQCPTPDSLLSADSAFPNSPYPSLVSTSDRTKLTTTIACDGSSTIMCSSSHSSTSYPPKGTNISKSSPCLNTSITGSTCTFMSQTSQTLSPSVKNHFLTDKLRYIKPLEGSQILNHWRMLASPTPNSLFENRNNYISRIKANLAAQEVKIEQQRKDSVNSSSDKCLTKETDTSDLAAYVNNFGGTSSVFTFTTTSFSQSINSTTNVTSTFTNVQPSIGKSIYKDLTFSCTPTMSTDGNVTINDLKNSAFVCSLQGSSESRTIQQTKTPLMYSSKFSQNHPKAPITTVRSVSRHSLSHIKSSMFTKMDPIGGLNELTKILERDRVMKHPINSISSSTGPIRMPIKQNLFVSSLIGTNLLNPNRIMTKAMVNANSELLSLTSIPTMDFSRTDVSALRNLRKGGLV